MILLTFLLILYIPEHRNICDLTAELNWCWMFEAGTKGDYLFK